MNTTTKLSAKTLMQLLATAMITLTLFSCGGGGDDTTTPPTTNPTTPTVTPTIVSTTATIVSMLSALATGTPSQVVISWSAAQGEDKYYRLYKSKTDLSGYQNASPTNLSKSSKVIITTHTTNASTITLSGTQTFYFLVTTIEDTDNDKIESYTNATQTAATAFAMPFLAVMSTGTGFGSTSSGNNYVTPTYRVWMDRNLGAAQVATSSTDTLAYGDLYQWGRSADGHQVSTTFASTDTIAGSVTPTHGQFIIGNGDWTEDGVDNNGALRSAYWGKTDGSSICPTGFRVPTRLELIDEANSWYSVSSIDAFDANLKWVTAGWRKHDATFKKGREINEAKNAAYLWSLTPATISGTVSETQSDYIYFEAESSSINNTYAIRSLGYSVRCIKPK